LQDANERFNNLHDYISSRYRGLFEGGKPKDPEGLTVHFATILGTRDSNRSYAHHKIADGNLGEISRIESLTATAYFQYLENLDRQYTEFKEEQAKLKQSYGK
jgi:hypothetical protein